MLFLDFYYRLRDWFHVPVTPGEYLTLVEAANKGLFSTVDEFYHVARSILVKDEKFFDAYDQAFLSTFKGKEGDKKKEPGDFESLMTELGKLAELPKVEQTFKEPDLAHPPRKNQYLTAQMNYPNRTAKTKKIAAAQGRGAWVTGERGAGAGTGSTRGARLRDKPR